MAAYFILASSAVLIIEPAYILSIIIVFVPPTIANFLWLKNSRFKIMLFSLTAALLFAPPIELVARLMNLWDVQSIFSRPFGLIPLEDMFSAFLNFLWVLSFYAYFTNQDQKKIWNKKFKYLIAIYIAFDIIIFGIFFYNPSWLLASYFDIAVIALLVPGSLIFYRLPKLLKKTILPTIFFAFIFFIYELVSLKIGSWFWPGEYWLSFEVFGQTFPMDDIIIWYFMSTPALIGGYEFFMGGITNNKSLELSKNRA